MVGTAHWPGFPAMKGAAMTEFDESSEDSLDVDVDIDYDHDIRHWFTAEQVRRQRRAPP